MGGGGGVGDIIGSLQHLRTPNTGACQVEQASLFPFVFLSDCSTPAKYLHRRQILGSKKMAERLKENDINAFVLRSQRD